MECDCSLMISVSIRIAWLNQSCEIGVRKSWDWPLPGNVRGFESFIEREEECLSVRAVVE